VTPSALNCSSDIYLLARGVCSVHATSRQHYL
jgi:hypothetical protein